MHLDTMWIWWGLTIALCAWKIGEGLLRPIRMLEWPFLACAMWAYFYGYMAYDAKLELSAYLGNGMSNIGQLMALLCLVGILVGWQLGKNITAARPAPARGRAYLYFWLAGLFFMLVGTVGGYSVMRAAQAGTMNYQMSTGYWYLLFYVGYPGLAIAIWSLLKMEPWLQKYLWIVTLLGLGAFMFPHLLTARRGPLFPAVIILLLVPPLTLRRPPNRLIYFGGLALAGLVMLLFLQIRSVTYNGGSWGQAVQALDVNTAISERGKQADDNEYVNSCQAIGTIFQNGKYQYGTGHLGLLVHWVPRAIWKDKPVLGEGLYTFDEMFDDIESATGAHLLGQSGASSGGVADSFVQYGVLCPLFWLGLSWLFGRVYARAIQGGSARWLLCYVGIICASHWLISQSLAAAFVPGMYFQLVPLTVFTLLDYFSTAPTLRHAPVLQPKTSAP